MTNEELQVLLDKGRKNHCSQEIATALVLVYIKMRAEEEHDISAIKIQMNLATREQNAFAYYVYSQLLSNVAGQASLKYYQCIYSLDEDFSWELTQVDEESAQRCIDYLMRRS